MRMLYTALAVAMAVGCASSRSAQQPCDPATEACEVDAAPVVDASTVVATHISQILNTHAAELLGRQEVQQLLDHLGREAPKLTEDLVPKVIPLATVQKAIGPSSGKRKTTSKPRRP